MTVKQILSSLTASAIAMSAFGCSSKKPEEKEELTPQQFLISIFGAVMFFVCLTVLKLPYDAENATLLNCYYLSLLAFAVICYAYNEFKDDKSKQLHIRRIFIIITIIVCCLGLYLYVSHLDYIDAHISEWGSFNKVSR